MRIIRKNSIIKNLPVELGTETILIFDAIRFGIEMVEYSYHQLILDIRKISRSSNRKNFPRTFAHAWAIIDNANKVRNICRQLPWENEREIVGHLHYLTEFRNTFQHIEDRINKERVFFSTQTPFFGVISWVYKFPDKDDFQLYQLPSGNLLFGPNAKQTVPKLSQDSKELNAILLHTVNQKGEKIEADLTGVMVNLKKLFVELEKRLKQLCIDETILPVDWSVRQDITLVIKSGKKGD